MNHHTAHNQPTNTTVLRRGVQRYGFNGVEQLNAQELVFDYRIYNPAIGRFISIDILFRRFPWSSAYAFCENSPIDLFENQGKEAQKQPRPGGRNGIYPRLNNDNNQRFWQRQQGRRLKGMQQRSDAQKGRELNRLIIENGMGAVDLVGGARPASTFGPANKPNYAVEVSRVISDLFEHSIEILEIDTELKQFEFTISSENQYIIAGGELEASLAYGKLLSLEADYQAEWKKTFDENLTSIILKDSENRLDPSNLSDLRLAAAAETNNQLGWASPLRLAQVALKEEYKRLGKENTTTVEVISLPSINPSTN
ncbi:MAG: RHS repeat-associated core domain-containing protein [Flavobacteriales bacterium]